MNYLFFIFFYLFEKFMIQQLFKHDCKSKYIFLVLYLSFFKSIILYILYSYIKINEFSIVFFSIFYILLKELRTI